MRAHPPAPRHLRRRQAGDGAGRHRHRRRAFISDLHTHASYPPGIIHVESPTEARFSLGQFFAVWGVPLSATCIGSLCEEGAKQLKAWVDGKPVAADPTRIVLAERQQIVIAYGTAAQEPTPVPATYDWPEGL